MTIARTFSSLLTTALLTSVGCGNSTEPAGGTTPAGGSSPTVSAPAAARSSATLTGDVITRFERGLRREIEAVRAAQQRSANAKTPQERGEAIQASFEDATIPLGAEAAGLPVDQYRDVRETITGVLRTLDMQGKIEGPMSIDLTRADEATKARLARDAFADLPPASAEALRAHLNQLVPVWAEYVNLTAVAG
jgi:hypothetical protein